MPDFTSTDLTGSRFTDVNLSDARFRSLLLNGTTFRSVFADRMEIDGPIQQLVVNGVDVMPLVEIAQEQSKALAARLVRECGMDREKQVRRAFRLTFGRSPRDEEVRLGLKFLEEQTDLLRERGKEGVAEEPAAVRALVDFCLALFNANEFVYVR